MLADDIENMAAKGCRSPIPVAAEMWVQRGCPHPLLPLGFRFFASELSSLVVASHSPADPSKVGPSPDQISPGCTAGPSVWDDAEIGMGHWLRSQHMGRFG